MMAETPAAGLPFTALAHDGGRPALVTPDGTLTYRDLATRVEEAGQRLGPVRRLLLIGMRSHPDAVALYLAALRGGHPVILVDAANAAAIGRLTDTYDPDVVAHPGEDMGDWGIVERRARSAHQPPSRARPPAQHLRLDRARPSSCGSPSRASTSNAESIATALGIGSDDRAITTLPLAYSYGLSVLHSHLQRGASVVLTDRSVIERGLLGRAPRHRCHVVRRGAVHVRPPRPRRLRGHAAPVPSVRDPGRRPPRPRQVRRLARARGAARAGSSMSCTARPRRPRG